MHFESSADPKIFTIPDDTKAEPGDSGFDLNQMAPGVPVEMSPEQFKEFREKLQQQKKEQQKNQAQVPAGAKQRILALLEIDRDTTEVKIGNKLFTLKTLKAKEVREIAQACIKLEFMTEVMFETRVQTLARSLSRIDGVDVEVYLGTAELPIKLDLLNEMSEITIAKLYEAYSVMMNKTAIKTESEAREVVEQIKK